MFSIARVYRFFENSSGGSRPGPGRPRPPLFVHPPVFHRLLIIATDDTIFTWRSSPPPDFFWLEPPLENSVRILIATTLYKLI